MYREGVVDLPFSFVLAQRGDRNVLVDTGFMQDDHASGFARKFGIPTWISPLRMLAEVGLSGDDISDVFITHAHFDHMGSIAEFPKAQMYIQKSELLSWYEAIALPKRFGHLTAIIDPDNLRTALDASIDHRVSLIDGDKDDVLPGIHVRLGERPHDRPAIRHPGNERAADGSFRATASIRAGNSPATTTTASMFRSTTRSAASGSS